MGYLDFYHYQAKARGVHSLEDVRRMASERAYVYDRIVLPWMPTDRSSRVVEIACGHGSFLCWAKERGYARLTGIDSSPEQIEHAREVGVEVVEADSSRWLASQPAASVRAFVAIDLIEHLSRDDFMDLLQGAQRVLLPGGRLILRYPNGDSPLVGRNLFNDITHIWTYTTNCIETLGRMHSFTQFAFIDESEAALRDNRWLKVPLCRLSTTILRGLFRAATKEVVRYWSPHIWACADKNTA